MNKVSSQESPEMLQVMIRKEERLGSPSMSPSPMVPMLFYFA